MNPQPIRRTGPGLRKQLIRGDQQHRLVPGPATSGRGISMQRRAAPWQIMVCLHRQLAQPPSNRAWRIKGPPESQADRRLITSSQRLTTLNTGVFSGSASESALHPSVQAHPRPTEEGGCPTTTASALADPSNKSASPPGPCDQSRQADNCPLNIPNRERTGAASSDRG